jgi:ABC-type multidrug transport system fused ATPase/permease subunit
VVLFRRNVTDGEVIQALKTAAIDDFVRRLPMGLDTRIGEGSGGLSGGQRQRLLIARAVVQRPRLIIFDEATSSLDVETESKILEALRAEGATIILISHRPEVWVHANRIYTLESFGLLQEEMNLYNFDAGRKERREQPNLRTESSR